MQQFTLNEDISVLYVQADSFPDGITAAFDQLFTILPKNNDRIIFGISHLYDGQIIYKAGAEQKPGDEAIQTALKSLTIRKGVYISQLVKNFMQHISLIGSTFQELLQHPDIDQQSFCAEWYKGDDVLCMIKLND